MSKEITIFYRYLFASVTQYLFIVYISCCSNHYTVVELLNTKIIYISFCNSFIKRMMYISVIHRFFYYLVLQLDFFLISLYNNHPKCNYN